MLAARLFALIAIVVSAATAQTTPLVPLNTSFTFWDHHWLQWTPQHPVYEAVEASMAVNPKNPKEGLLRVWFTERVGGKRQVFYFNDAAMAKNWRGEGYFREMDFRIGGEPGQPRDLTLKFSDKDNHSVEWTLKFDAAAGLSNSWAGLKPQGGHAAETVFLLWYLGNAQTTTKSVLHIGGQDYSFKSPPPEDMRQYYYQAAYTAGVLAGVVTFGECVFSPRSAGFGNSTGRSFQKAGETAKGVLYRSDDFGLYSLNHIELETTPKGELRGYRHYYGEHVFSIVFEEPLPSSETGKEVGYSMSLDEHAAVVQGALAAKEENKALQLLWKHQQPEWTHASVFQSTIFSLGPGTYKVIVSHHE